MDAQTAEDELGDWLIYNGTVRFSERWSLFTEAQQRGLRARGRAVPHFA